MINLPKARVFTSQELAVGMTAEFDRAIVEDDILTFAANSGDANPLHVDADYAKQSNFGGRIVHGAFQVGLASALIGMHLPGQNVLLGGINARFPSPLFFPCNVNVRGEIVTWSAENRAGQLRVIVREASTLTPTAEVHMSFTLHERRDTPRGESDALIASKLVPLAIGGRKVVLVTGASGGVGEAIAADLATDYTVIGLSNRHSLSQRLLAFPGVRELRVDLATPSAAEIITSALGGQPLYGIVYAAWPGAPRGGLLQSHDDVLGLQLAFGTTHLIRLARLLFGTVDLEAGGRIVALGSIFGARKPAITLATYSLGKIALEATVNLLSPEMARKKITVNAICPSYIPAGLNRQAEERQIKAEAARVPLGRVCEVTDVAAVVRQLLSPAASFLSGEVIGLNGGQL